MMLASFDSIAESGSYRIEVLVFNHLDSVANPLEIEEIRSFNEFPAPGEPLVAEAPVKLTVVSDVMQSVMRRLRLSANYHPIVFLSWEQTRIDYHPPVRVHDGEVIASQLHFPQDIAFIDLRDPDPFAGYEISYHRLDGTIQLQRTRFLHVNLDLEFRQALLPQAPDDELFDANDTIESVLATNPGPAMVHTLMQSRQIRTGQMQYFDTPFLGVLVRVTATAGR
jgi:hypothetical protein